MSDHLFCYGTLMEPRVLKMITGKEFTLKKATLPDYQRYRVKGEDYPGVVQKAGEGTDGMLCLGVTASHLKKLDQFEGDLYRRQLVKVNGPYNRTVNAWCYIVPRRAAMRLSKEAWEFEQYFEKFMRRYNLPLEPKDG